MAMIWPFFAICFAFICNFILFLARVQEKKFNFAKETLSNFAKLIIKVFFWAYIGKELAGTLVNNLNFSPGDYEFYNMLPPRSDRLISYDYE